MDPVPGVSTEAPPRPEPGESADPSLRSLLTAVGGSITSLLAAKLKLAEREASRDFAILVAAGGLLATGALLGLLALGFAGAAAALYLARWTGSPATGALIVAAVYLTGALAALAVARSRLKRMGGFLRETRTDLQRDAEWLKKLS